MNKTKPVHLLLPKGKERGIVLCLCWSGFHVKTTMKREEVTCKNCLNMMR